MSSVTRLGVRGGRGQLGAIWLTRFAVAALLLLSLGCSQRPSSHNDEPNLRASKQALTLPDGFVEENLGGTWDRAVGITFSTDRRLFV
jgi:hypothetical protein